MPDLYQAIGDHYEAASQQEPEPDPINDAIHAELARRVELRRQSDENRRIPPVGIGSI